MGTRETETSGVRKEKYDSGSDSEGYADDLDDDEPLFSLSDIPKLQFRKEASKARWVDDLAMAEVAEKKGKMWTTTGISRGGKTYCLIEETLFLAEIGALNVLNSDDIPVSLCDMYGMIAKYNHIHGFSWESFEVYRHLKSLGYIVGRHGTAWSSKDMKTSVIAEKDMESSTGDILSEKLSSLTLTETKLMFDVYLPNSKFKKSSPGSPCFVLCVISGQPPSKQEIERLEMCCNGIPLKFSIVEHGRVSFLSFTKVELPVLP